MVEISNLEVVSHSMPGESPRPLRFRFVKNEEVYKGKVLRINDKKLNKWNGNIMFEYICECIIEDHPTRVSISYEKDTMKWYLKTL